MDFKIVTLSLIFFMASIHADSVANKIFVPSQQEFIKVPDSQKLAYLNELVKIIRGLAQKNNAMTLENNRLKQENSELRRKINEPTPCKS